MDFNRDAMLVAIAVSSSRRVRSLQFFDNRAGTVPGARLTCFAQEPRYVSQLGDAVGPTMHAPDSVRGIGGSRHAGALGR